MSGPLFAADAPLVVSPDLIAPRPGVPAVASEAPAAASEVRAPAGGPTPAADQAYGGAPAASANPAVGAGPREATDLPTPAPGATELRALRIFGTRALELVADGEAELQRDDIRVSADRLTYRELTDEVLADGNVRLLKDGTEVTGPRARLIVHEWTGEVETPRYALTRPTAPETPDAPREVTGSGEAEVMLLEGENQYRLRRATWTTCEAPDPDWYIKADDLRLDYDREVGTAHGSSIVFKDVPIFWWPWTDFPLVAQRKSGFLTPTAGIANRTGVDVSLPYYWNIAPNYDATLSPRLMARRGLQFGGEFRYLTASYRGESRLEWMPRDQVTRERRSLGSLQHQHRLAPGLHASLDVNAVSDRTYFEDLSSRVAVAVQTNLLREGRLGYSGGGWWTASALAQSYQTLSGVAPYRRLPQLALNAARRDLPAGGVFAFAGEFARFDHPDAQRITGNRLVAYPQLSLPYRQAGYFIVPKIGLHVTRYDLDRPFIADGREDIQRTVPILSVDGGLFFDRPLSLFGGDYEQSLEPRLFYVRVPHRRQDDVPVFDSARYDFGFAQIFSENRYSGSDRIADSNQVTVAVTSRLVESATGIERLRGTIGQRYYFSDRRVALPGETLSLSNSTDILAALAGRVTATTTLDTSLQYNPEDGLAERFNFYLSYRPGHAKVLNLGYRYARDAVQDARDGLRDLDLSAQWPLGGRWFGVGRINRSIKEGRITEAVAGVEYDGGCWVFRTAAHRFATNPDDVTNALFVQLELSGLASLGSNPVNLLRRSVPGYGKISGTISDRIFGGN